tara:strand:- start:844 stop:1314 length:471 start_codon:yes stop_codon:yes gene_type:complete
MKIISILFLLFISCDDNVYEPTFLDESYLHDTDWSSDDENCNYMIEITSYLPQDGSGYYVMDFLSEYNQTFTTLTVETESYEYNQKVSWLSNKEIEINGWWINLVNGDSYTDEIGEAHTVLGVWEEFVGDTVTVYGGYTDECNIHHYDSLMVIIKE